MISGRCVCVVRFTLLVLAAIAARVSPTNIGLLLNARQVACEFGYLTVPEFVEQTQQTLATIAELKKYRGHVALRTRCR